MGITKDIEQGSCFPSDLCIVLESRREGISRQKNFFFFKNETTLATSVGGQEEKTRVERGLD